MCKIIHSVPRSRAALFRPCHRRWAILLSLDTKLFGEPQRQQLPTACPAPPINLHNSFTQTNTASTLACLPHFCTHVPPARTRLFCPVRSSALLQLHSHSHSIPRETSRPALRTSRHYGLRMAARVPCAPAPAHAQGSLALYAPLRSQLHSRACCTHRLSCLVRSLALSC